MQVYAGIDLHSNNSYLALIDGDYRRLFDKRLPNKIGVIDDALTPFKDQLSGVVVESTFNWYWLVDGLAEAGYQMHLSNLAAVVFRLATNGSDLKFAKAEKVIARLRQKGRKPLITHAKK